MDDHATAQTAADLRRRYYRAMRLFKLWGAPGCEENPVHTAVFERLAN